MDDFTHFIGYEVPRTMSDNQICNHLSVYNHVIPKIRNSTLWRVVLTKNRLQQTKNPRTEGGGIDRSQWRTKWYPKTGFLDKIDRISFGQFGSKLTNHGPFWSVWVLIAQLRAVLVDLGPNWSITGRFGW